MQMLSRKEQRLAVLGSTGTACCSLGTPPASQDAGQHRSWIWILGVTLPVEVSSDTHSSIA